MKALKITAIAVVAYLGIVVAFEASFGYFQPAVGSAIVITTFDGDGSSHDRAVTPVRSGGQLYVAANHWPRKWYARALGNPDVQITLDGDKGDYRAVPVTGAEHDRVNGEKALPLIFRFLSGFAPRYFIRLDPR